MKLVDWLSAGHAGSFAVVDRMLLVDTGLRLNRLLWVAMVVLDGRVYAIDPNLQTVDVTS